MKYSEWKEKGLEALRKSCKDKKMELFELRVQLKTMQLKDSHKIRLVRKEIARINTAITAIQKEKAGTLHGK